MEGWKVLGVKRIWNGFGVLKKEIGKGLGWRTDKFKGMCYWKISCIFWLYNGFVYFYSINNSFYSFLKICKLIYLWMYLLESNKNLNKTNLIYCEDKNIDHKTEY